MIPVLAAAVALLAGSGVWLLLERRLVRTVAGLVLLGHAANLLVLSSGGVGRTPAIAPVAAGAADPLPQALVLTAIVISLAVTVYLLALVAALGAEDGVGELDPAPADDAGREPEDVRRELGGAS